MISISLSSDFDPRHQQKFRDSGPVSLPEFIHLISTNIWSPIIWQGGIRTKRTFLSSAYMALDFDGTKPLAEMVTFCRDYGLSHIIGTTKSHQKEKQSTSGKLDPAADRFRVVLRADGSCTDLDRYEYNLSILTDHFGCDESCTDAARFFYPCRDIVSFGKGKSVKWLEVDKTYLPLSQRINQRRERNSALAKVGVLPLWISKIFDNDEIPESDRHKAALRIGIELSEIGWEPERIYARLSTTKLGKYVGGRELMRHIENGSRINNEGFR